MVTRFDVFLINLDEAPSADPKNTRPAVVVSPDELNRARHEKVEKRDSCRLCAISAPDSDQISPSSST